MESNDSVNFTGHHPPEDNYRLATFACTVFSTIVHAAGTILVVTTLTMFVRNRCLQRKGNIFEMNLLLSDICLLLASLIKLGDGGDMACALYSVFYLLFSAVSTLTAAAIAVDRYLLMIHSSISQTNVSGQTRSSKYWLERVFCIWITSCLLLLAPLLQLVSAGWGTICLYTDGFLYATVWYPVLFESVTVLVPILVVAYCYVSIYRKVKKAQDQTWLSQALAYRRQTGQSFELRSSQPPIPKAPRLSKKSLIVMKGLAAVAIFSGLWMPFSVSWIVTSMVGSSVANQSTQTALILLTKVSVSTNILYFIIFSTKFNQQFRDTWCIVFSKCKQKPSDQPPRSTLSIPVRRQTLSCPPSIAYPEESDTDTEQGTSNIKSVPTVVIGVKTASKLTRGMSFPVKASSRRVHASRVVPSVEYKLAQGSSLKPKQMAVLFTKSKSLETP